MKSHRVQLGKWSGHLKAYGKRGKQWERRSTPRREERWPSGWRSFRVNQLVLVIALRKGKKGSNGERTRSGW